MEHISKLKNQYPHIKDKLYCLGNIFDDNSQTYIYKIRKRESQKLLIEFYSYMPNDVNVTWRKENTNITLKVIELKFTKHKNDFLSRYHVSDEILNSIN